MQLRISLFIALLFSSYFVVAQTGTIKGFVYEKGTGEPMSYTLVILKGTKIGVQTDLNGFFSIPNVPVGNYTVISTLIGYDTASSVISIKADAIVNLRLLLARAERTLVGVDVSARKTEKITQINAGTTTITPREMKLLPSAGGAFKCGQGCP